MKLMRCVGCKLQYIIGSRQFYGPIFEDGSTSNARMQPISDLKEGYGDCERNLVEVNRV